MVLKHAKRLYRMLSTTASEDGDLAVQINAPEGIYLVSVDEVWLSSVEYVSGRRGDGMIELEAESIQRIDD